MKLKRLSQLFAWGVIPIWFMAFFIYLAQPDVATSEISRLWLAPLPIWLIVMWAEFHQTAQKTSKSHADFMVELERALRKEESR